MAKAMSKSDKAMIEEQTNMIIAHFFFAIVWSVGATLDGRSRLKFDEFFKSLCDMEGSNAKYPKYVWQRWWHTGSATLDRVCVNW